ncbi:hypothetical protein SARC_10965, partial [Sphaeroforma arctica JP610]
TVIKIPISQVIDASSGSDWDDDNDAAYATCPSTPRSTSFVGPSDLTQGQAFLLPGTASYSPDTRARDNEEIVGVSDDGLSFSDARLGGSQKDTIPRVDLSSSVSSSPVPAHDLEDDRLKPARPGGRVRRVSEDFDNARSEMKGVLHVEVIDAQGLPQQWMRSRVSFVVISIGLQIYRTSVHKARLADPVWHQELRFLLNGINEIYDMTFAIYRKNIKYGHSSINIKEVLRELTAQPGCYKDFFLPIIEDYATTATDKDIRGQMHEAYVPKYRVAGLTLRMRYLPKENVEKTFLESLLTYFNTESNNRISTGDCLALLDQLGIVMTEYQFERFWKSIAPENSTEITVDDFMGALNKLSFQESGVMQRLLSYIDFGEEFLHHYVLGGFLSVEEASKNYAVPKDKTFSRNDKPIDPSDKKMSEREGTKMNKPESCFNIPGFVALHNIATHEIEKPIEEFRTFNEFFSRRLAPGARRDHALGNEKVALCCADCRLMTFQTWKHSQRLWVKGTQFNFASMVGPELQHLVPYFDNASLCISRLAPQDYHRWHMPVTGKYVNETFIDGQYYTVNPIAIKSEGFDVFTENKRIVSEFMTEAFGLVLLVAVGATLVGGIDIFPKIGQDLKKFDEHGTFFFGGSTVIVVFQEGVINMDTDLLATSMRSMETLVRVGQTLGTATGKAAKLDASNYDSVVAEHSLKNLKF